MYVCWLCKGTGRRKSVLCPGCEGLGVEREFDYTPGFDSYPYGY